MILNNLRVEHIPDLLPIWNRPEVLSVLAATMTPMSQADLADTLVQTRYGTHIRTWTIIDNEKIVGTISLSNMNPVTKNGEITNRVVADEAGWLTGLLATRKVIDIGFMDLGLNRIECYVHADNRATHALCKRLKTKRDAILRQAAFKEGKFMDIYVYSLLREEYGCPTS